MKKVMEKDPKVVEGAGRIRPTGRCCNSCTCGRAIEDRGEKSPGSEGQTWLSAHESAEQQVESEGRKTGAGAVLIRTRQLKLYTQRRLPHKRYDRVCGCKRGVGENDKARVRGSEKILQLPPPVTAPVRRSTKENRRKEKDSAQTKKQ